MCFLWTCINFFSKNWIFILQTFSSERKKLRIFELYFPSLWTCFSKSKTKGVFLWYEKWLPPMLLIVLTRSNVLDTSISMFSGLVDRGTLGFLLFFVENCNSKDKHLSCSFQVFQNHLHVNDICKLFLGINIWKGKSYRKL